MTNLVAKVVERSSLKTMTNSCHFTIAVIVIWTLSIHGMHGSIHNAMWWHLSSYCADGESLHKVYYIVHVHVYTCEMAIKKSLPPYSNNTTLITITKIRNTGTQVKIIL